MPKKSFLLVREKDIEIIVNLLRDEYMFALSYRHIVINKLINQKLPLLLVLFIISYLPTDATLNILKLQVTPN